MSKVSGKSEIGMDQGFIVPDLVIDNVQRCDTVEVASL